MKVFMARNSNEMADLVYPELKEVGIKSTSRNGPVLRFAEPVTFGYTEPWNRANSTHGRDANVFFHIAESMWMLAGRQDVEFLKMFNSNIDLYSDDGVIFNAPYGYRIRKHFGVDQLQSVVDILMDAPESRQAIVQIWDSKDLNKTTFDKACNMTLVFSIVQNRLQLIVYNRSNDLVFGGVTGANPVHFSYFQQWVADMLGLKMGILYFVTANGHVYTELYDHWKIMDWTKYKNIPATYSILPATLSSFEHLCEEVIAYKYINSKFHNVHLDCIVKPMLNAFLVRKYRGDVKEAISLIKEIKCEALYDASMAWVSRRIK